jgi:hypothetical protein
MWRCALINSVQTADTAAAGEVQDGAIEMSEKEEELGECQ